MVLFPNCKINLGLHVIRKREDGYHDIETAFYPLHFFDVLEATRAGTNRDLPSNIKLSLSGFPVDSNPEENLCIKAFHILKKDFPHLPYPEMHLHKAIPVGAGLGGGSADGAFMLKLINEKFELSLSNDQLLNYALQLGSDCPFFIINKPCIATGRGDVLNEIDISLSSYQVVIVNPGLHISTNWAFSNITSAQPSKSIHEIIEQPVEAWKDELKNDFEKIVFMNYPEIETIKNTLYKEGAVFSLMSGSGSSVYGIFKMGVRAQFNFPPGYFVKTIGVKR